MRLRSPIGHRKARIEIIPLIDIMFFLLACFMLVSLSMVQMRGMKVDLPTASASTPENKNDFFAITLDAQGRLYLEKDELPKEALIERAKALLLAQPTSRFYVRADQGATHGDVVTILDRLHKAGIHKVSFELRAQSVTAPLPGAEPPPMAPSAGTPSAAPAAPADSAAPAMAPAPTLSAPSNLP